MLNVAAGSYAESRAEESNMNYAFSKDHFFLGWATSPEAAAAEYQPGDTFTTDADTVLYAVWMDTVDVGEIGGKGTYNIEYPTEGRGAFVSFTPGKSGNYVIHSTGSYFKSINTMPELSYGEPSNRVGAAKRNGDDCEMLVELTAGVKYYFQYQHIKNPFPLEIMNQYSYQIQTADIKMPSSLTAILDNAFRGAAFRTVVIPESVMYVGSGAFAECSELEIVIVMGTSRTRHPTASPSCTSSLRTGCTSFRWPKAPRRSP